MSHLTRRLALHDDSTPLVVTHNAAQHHISIHILTIPLRSENLTRKHTIHHHALILPSHATPIGRGSIALHLRITPAVSNDAMIHPSNAADVARVFLRRSHHQFSLFKSQILHDATGANPAKETDIGSGSIRHLHPKVPDAVTATIQRAIERALITFAGRVIA